MGIRGDFLTQRARRGICLGGVVGVCREGRKGEWLSLADSAHARSHWRAMNSNAESIEAEV